MLREILQRPQIGFLHLTAREAVVFENRTQIEGSGRFLPDFCRLIDESPQILDSLTDYAARFRNTSPLP